MSTGNSNRPIPPLPSFPGVEYRYVPDAIGHCVGNDGSLWSCWSTRYIGTTWKRIGKPNKDGYPAASIKYTAGRRARPIHDVILEVFVGPCPPGMECRHLDGSRTNNNLSNLVWGTRHENCQDRLRHGTHARGEQSVVSVLTDAQVLEMRARAAAGERIYLIAQDYPCCATTIRRAISGDLRPHLPGAVPHGTRADWVKRRHELNAHKSTDRCGVPGCQKPIGMKGARGMCWRHYQEWYRSRRDGAAHNKP